MATSIKDVMDFFGKGEGGLKGFSDEWKLLTPEDKDQIKEGLENGSLTY
jgi:hypothetical protein